MPYTTVLTEAKVNHFFNVETRIPESTMVKLREEDIERPKPWWSSTLRMCKESQRLCVNQEG